ncbi:MAG: DUF58 domain-containing protein [Eubacterium sp.]|nr:DUF58 domain-containing protein [Eubacterium sp.]
MIDRNYFEKISRLRLAVSKKSTSVMQGARKSLAKGSSAEFSDFREYMQGDDIRRIDWNAYGRTERLFVKEYVEERESSISILIDTSASMFYGEPMKNELAEELAAALSYIGLSGNDHVYLYDMKNMDKPVSLSGGLKAFKRGRAFLENLRFSGNAAIWPAVRRMQRHGSGLTIIISDLMDEGLVTDENRQVNLEKIFKYLAYCRQNIVLIHVLDKTEADPEFLGTHNLIDMENEKSRVRVTMDNRTVDEYKKTFKAFTDSLEKTARRYRAVYAKAFTDKKFERIIFEDLREIYDI